MQLGKSHKVESRLVFSIEKFEEGPPDVVDQFERFRRILNLLRPFLEPAEQSLEAGTHVEFKVDLFELHAISIDFSFQQLDDLLFLAVEHILEEIDG